MWEVGLWGSKNLGSGTLGSKKCGKWDYQDAVSPPPPPPYRVFGIVRVAIFAPTCYYRMLCSSMYIEGMPLSPLVIRRTC